MSHPSSYTGSEARSDDPITGKLNISPKYVKFSNELFADIINDHNGSIAISPLFIQSALALLSVGADGKTFDIMRDSLQLSGMSRADIENQFQSLLQPYANASAGSALQFATGIFANNKYSLIKPFRRMANEKFNALVQLLNCQNSEQAAANINDWVGNATNNNIKQIIKPSAINKETTLLLANAVHFHGLWQHEFAMETVQTMEFYTNGNCVRSNAKALASVFDTVSFKKDTLVKAIYYSGTHLFK